MCRSQLILRIIGITTALALGGCSYSFQPFQKQDDSKQSQIVAAVNALTEAVMKIDKRVAVLEGKPKNEKITK